MDFFLFNVCAKMNREKDSDVQYFTNSIVRNFNKSHLMVTVQAGNVIKTQLQGSYRSGKTLGIEAFRPQAAMHCESGSVAGHLTLAVGL